MRLLQVHTERQKLHADHKRLFEEEFGKHMRATKLKPKHFSAECYGSKRGYEAVAESSQFVCCHGGSGQLRTIALNYMQFNLCFS